MLKKILAIGSFAAIAAALGINSTESANNEEVSVADLISANTEALAYCPNGCIENGQVVNVMVGILVMMSMMAGDFNQHYLISL